MPAIKDGASSSASIIEAINRLDARFDAIDARFDAIDAKFDAIDAKFNTIDAKFNTIDAKFDAIDANVINMQGDIATINAKLDLNPIRALNATSSFSAPVKFPPGIDLEEIIPQKQSIDTLTRRQCITVLDRLGVPWQAGNSVPILKDKIKDYLYAW
ncbi:hypothetical protein TWF718_000207 [Orbilia javanica]|uniref:Uncharacterized protein n=1 Tax=Orbilia javanica TaxID=47235 RepID=A0AAN8P0V1_9PEZI